MKIDHKALGLAAPLAGGAPAEAAGEEGFPSVFGSLLHAEQPAQPEGWRRVLRLDAPPASQRPIGPPPAPPGMEAVPGPAQRLQLRRLIRRHARWLDRDSSGPAESSGSGEGNAIAGMLALLANYQDLEEAIVARQLAESVD